MNRLTFALSALAASVNMPPVPYRTSWGVPQPRSLNGHGRRYRGPKGNGTSRDELAAEAKRQRKAAKALRGAERRAAGLTPKWNRCPTCAQFVDADDVFDGSEVRCHSCNQLLVVALLGECTWALVPADEDDEIGDES